MEAWQVNMSTLLTLKKFFKKGWAFLKHNWYVPAVLIYTAFLWLVFRRKDAAYKVLKIRTNSYEAQIEAINKAHTEEIDKRNKILENSIPSLVNGDKIINSLYRLSFSNDVNNF